MKKIVSLLMAITLCFTLVLTSCSKKNDEINTDIEPVSFEKTETMLVENGKSDYKIVIPENPSEMVLIAASELNLFLKESTGVELQVVTDKGLEHDNAQKHLSIGNTTLLREQTDIVIDYSVMGECGPSVDTRENTVYMCGATEYGTLFSVYRFLKYQIGFVAYAKDCVVVDYYNSVNLLDFNYHYVPAVDVQTFGEREHSVDTVEDLVSIARLGGFSHRHRGAGGPFGLSGAFWGAYCHTVKSVMPEAEYADFYDRGQLCYTHPDVVEVFSNNFIEKFASTPKWPWFMFGGEDTAATCTCSRCAEAHEKYTPAGVYVRFMNAVAENVEKYYEENNIDATLVVAGLGYHEYSPPPIEKDEDGNYKKDKEGNYIPVDESVVPDNEGQVQVGMCYVPRGVCVLHPFHDEPCEDNLHIEEEMKGWGNLTKWVFVYTYGGNYSYVTGFMNSWSQLTTVYDLFKQTNVTAVFWDNSKFNGYRPLSTLRIFYALSLGHNPYQDPEKLVLDFCDNYYGPASKAIQEYLNLNIEHYNSIYERDSLLHHFYEESSVNSAEMWPHNILIAFSNILQTGMNAIDKSSCTDEQKEIYKERVFREYFFTKYHELTYFEPYLTYEELQEAKAVVDYGIKKYEITNA